MKKIGTLIGRGKTAAVHEWGAREVIKLFDDRSCGLAEARNAEIIGTLDVRAPEFVEALELDGRIGIVYERIVGQPMLRQIEPTLESISSNARLMARLQFEINGIRPEAEPNLKREIVRRVSRSAFIRDSDKALIIDETNKHPDGAFLCHYDFHPDNIILSPSGPVVIDWMTALVGDPRADVARSSMILLSNALPPDAPNQATDRAFRETFHTYYLTEYFALSGWNQRELDEWLIPTLANRIDELAGYEQDEVVGLLDAALRVRR